MPVRGGAVSRRQRDLVMIRGTAVAAIAFAALCPLSLGAQEPSDSMPATHTVKRGDTLWDIAKLYLGDAFLWPEIYRLNTSIIEDPHWIYPGEVLKLPAPARVVAVTPPPPPAAESTIVAPAPKPLAPTQPQPQPAPPEPQQILAPAARSVRIGEYAASPWVDEPGGPRGSGYIMRSADLPGISSADRSRLNLYDRVLITPPVGAVAPERELYLSYRLGPNIEDFGQIVIPTGLIQITRSPRNGEAAIGRVVKMFSQMRADQRLIAYDSTAGVVIGRPSPVTNGRAGKVRWILSEPVLPSLQSYVIVDIARRDGIAPGDQIELFQPRQAPPEGNELAEPEVFIGYGQVLRVTSYGATAILTSHEQPKIADGTAARISAKMP